MQLVNEKIVSKWNPILDHSEYNQISDPIRRQVTAAVLENTEKSLRDARESSYLFEAPVTNTQGGGNVATWDPILIGLVRRSMPNLIAYEVCGVQPMSGPAGIIFALRSRYTNQTGAEALFNEADTDFSGAGSHATSSPFDVAFSTGTGLDTLTGENLGTGLPANNPSQMGVTIERVNVAAKTRMLSADFSRELAQDLKAIHNLNAENELAQMLSAEILAEINREVIRTIYLIARRGSQKDTATPGVFDLDTDSSGRWSVEKFKGLLYQVERDANQISKETRRDKGNIIICSSDVASALMMSGTLSYAPALSTNLQVNDSGNTFAGVLNNQYKVFVDPYFSDSNGNELLCVGYKGTNPYDAGLFYCPYIPLELLRATGQDSFQPRIAFKTRYGIVANPYYTNSVGAITAQSNPFYRLSAIKNLM